jgi:LexA-binding, inner membrane-associated putative hydrolase
MIGVIFGLLPDVDVVIIIIALIKGDKSKIDGLDFKHHAYPTHFPLLYSPLIVIMIIFPNIYTFTMVTALYLHLFTDSFYTSDGIKWLYPFQNKYFCFLSEKTKGKHGILWENEYKGTAMYKLEFILLIIAGSIVLLNHIFYYSTPVEYAWLLGMLIIGFIIGFFFVDRARFASIKKKAAETMGKV